jgi:hypothetical protein
LKVGIIYQRWHDIEGTDVSTMMNHENLLSPPDIEEVYSDYFESPSNICDNCGTKMEGLYRPAVSGLHTFKIAADDNAHLWFGDTEEMAMANSEIASIPGWTSPREWNKYESQTSAPIDLRADQLYFIRAVANEGGGGDNLAVGVTTPSGDLYPIPVSGTDAHTYLYYNPMALASSDGSNIGAPILCSACELGRYDHDADSTSACESCPVDTYQDQPGATGCIVCPMGRTSMLGSTSADACCPIGFFGTRTSCSPCIAPYYDLDQSATTPCAACSGETFR